MQTKRHSALEAFTNTVIGIFLALGCSQLFHIFEHDIQLYIWQGFTWNISLESNIIVTLILTVVSVLRGYIIRRIFNKRT